MDLFDPSDSRPVHFMGIGGAGMSALALVARRRGVAVTGCDTDPSGAADVAALGASVWAGHAPDHVTGARAIVVTAAVPRNHPELEAARAAGIPIIPRKEALAQLIHGRVTIALAGTHGKTTTTVMTTLALGGSGFQPTALAGGRVVEWGGNARLGADQLFVVEADEYDQAFLALQPTVAVVNNVEPDHLECYGSVAALETAFVAFADRAGTAFVGANDPGAARVGARLRNRIFSFGFAPADLLISDVDQGPEGSRARLTFPDGRQGVLSLRVPGVHNLRNAAAALGVVWALEGDLDAGLAALAEYGGVGRRFERLGEAGGIAFVDDYAHHESELAATLSAARQAFPGRRLVAVFQPHLYSRTAAHGQAMGVALAAADLVIVTGIYAAREAPLEGVSGGMVADAAAAAGAETVYIDRRPEVSARVRELLRPGDVVVTLGAGDITRVGRELAEWLRAA
ncbi:MAG: UDP-N-acetylmuramate--L-alanine ligase [Gemmatimonadales bacterium]